ncbi:hypothetical protein [Actinomadura litoris]|uniref:hypothetical protein n=1 Tax=Actinomadura litoris TaxID=2678616 RepID=UPI001FA757C6|nr:hypothetical protein [Actinomadura litoris]
MTTDARPLAGKVALVAGGTRGGGRGIAVEVRSLVDKIAALAADPGVMAKTGRALATWGLYQEYGFTDVDGAQPDFAARWAENLEEQYGPLGDPL